MPANGTEVLDTMYPSNGYSSWFGGDRGNPLPSAMPYGVILKAPGSTGRFSAYNQGVKFKLFSPTSTSETTVVGSQRAFGSIAFPRVTFMRAGSGSTQINVLYYLEGGLPIFVYQKLQALLWQNTRKVIFILGPGPPPFPLFDKVGDVVQLTPFNRKGFNELE